MGRKLSVAFAGAGGIARAHLEAILKLGDLNVQVTGFADPDAERCQARLRELKAARPDTDAACFSDAVKMLRSVEADAVYIVVPPFAHGPVERYCIEHRIPFFVEKPIGLDMALVRELSQEIEQKSLLTCAGYMNRYRRGIQEARSTLQEDPAVLLHGGWIGASPARVPGSWWPQKHLSGGQVVEQSTHTFDLVRYLGGEAEEVYAIAAVGFNKDIPGYTIEDASAVAIRLRSGAVASVLSCCAANGGGGGVWLHVFAQNVSFLFHGWEHSLTVLRRGEDAVDVPGEPNIFEIEDRVFLNAVLTGNGTEIRSTYSDAARTLELTLAANAAIETGRPQALR